MGSLSKLQSLNSHCNYKLLSFHRSHILQLSTLSKTSKSTKSNRRPEIRDKNHSDAKNTASLLKEISQILGTESTSSDKTQSRLAFSEQTQQNPSTEPSSREQPLSYSQGVCENACEGYDTSSVSEKGQQPASLDGDYVSPVVQKVTEIVRSESHGPSMEERLEKSGLQFHASIVEKVLKRCFKVPHLAIRFFNWVKYRDEFFHSTETYNAMLSIAGEAKEFWLVEKLLARMELSSCQKDIKTWIILLSQFAKANSIGKVLATFEEMKNSGCEPDALAYKMMIRFLCSAQKTDIAMEFYREMVQKGWALDMNTYKLLLNCFAKSEKHWK